MNVFIPRISRHLVVSGAGLLFGYGSHAQYCVGGPSSNADSQVESVQITGVSSSINYTTGCPGTTGVENLTAYSVTVSAGSLYHLYVQFGTCGGNYAGAGEAWIDYNHNFIFEPGESLGTWTGTPPTTASDFAFTVPWGASNGITRMRIIQQENATPPLNPCASFTWGSVMDFSVNIQGGISCTGYPGDDFPGAISVASLPYVDTNNTSVCYTNNFPVYSAPDVYYRFITSATAFDLHITTCNSLYDTYISLLDKNGNILAYNDDGFICGSNSDILYYPGGADTFYVVVDGWNLSSGEYILKIEENSGLGLPAEEISSFGLYPNPAQTEVTLSSVPRHSKIEITDMNGRVWKSLYWTDEKTIQVNELPQGLYLLRAAMPGKGIFHKKLIIQRP